MAEFSRVSCVLQMIVGDQLLNLKEKKKHFQLWKHKNFK